VVDGLALLPHNTYIATHVGVNDMFSNITIKFAALQVRIGWYNYRKEDGFPITWRRALFSDLPRFGSYERNEPGCPVRTANEYRQAGDK
jgi:hypothetical protein